MHRYLAGSLFSFLIVASAIWPQPPVPDKAAPGDSKPRLDRNGDSLPPNAVDRLGSPRLWHSLDIPCFAVSPDGKTLASGGDDKKIRLWDKATGKEIQHFNMDMGYVYCLAFSPNGKTLAFSCTSYDRHLFGLLDLQSGKTVHYTTNVLPLRSLLFTPDGKSLISSDYDTIRIWNTTTGKLRRHVALPHDVATKESVGTAVPSPDGKTLAIVGSYGQAIVLWDMATRKEIRRWDGLDSDAQNSHRMAFSPDSKTLVTAGASHRLQLWDTATGKLTGLLVGHTEEVSAVTFSPDGNWIASTGEDGTIRLWDPVSRMQMHCFGQHYGASRLLAFFPDGKTLVSAGSKIHLWDVASQRELLPTPGHQEAVRDVTLSPDGKVLASVGSDQTLRIWDLATGKEQRQFELPKSLVGHCAFSPDGKSLAWADDKTLYLADLATGKVLRPHESGAWIRCFAYSPDGKWLASGGNDPGIDLRNPVNGKLLRTIKTDNSVAQLAFSADGRILAAVSYVESDHSAVLWDTATGKELVRLKGTRLPAWFVTFNPDGTLVLTGGSDNTVRLWDVRTGTEIRQMQGSTIQLSSAVFSPDGQTIAGTPLDGPIHLWETATGQVRCRFEGHRSKVTSVIFSRDGRRLISGSADTTILVWDVSGMLSAPDQQQPAIRAEEWDGLWADLGGEDAGTAHQAIWKMVSAQQTVRLLGARLPPVGPKEIERIPKLVRQLDSDDFKERQHAQKELEKCREIAEPELQRALANKPSLEVKVRIEEILAGIKGVSPELRTSRAMEVLELIGNPEAKSLVQSLAKGPPEVRVTQLAKGALQRLEKRDGKP